MKTSKTKTFHYKKASFNNDSDGFSLQELIEEAYTNTKTAFDCAYSFQNDGENFHLINYFSANHRRQGARDILLGAEFLSFIKGNDPILINTAQTSRELPLEASNLSKEGKEAIEGAVYFGVVDNDIVLTQSMALRFQDLEKYLNWLIRTKGTLWTKENYVGLIDPGLSRQKRQKANDDAREITIFAPVTFRPVKPEAETKDYKVKASGVGIEAIKALFAGLPQHDRFVDEFKVEELEMSRSLEIELHLRWTGKRDDPKPYNLMEQVTRQFRHVTDEFQYTVETEDGTTITSDQIKRSLPHSVSWDGARPVFDDLFPKMLKWLGEIRR
jgi:hypothetical protein